MSEQRGDRRQFVQMGLVGLGVALTSGGAVAQGDSKQLPKLTDAERETARLFNMSDEDYAKQKAAAAKPLM